MLATPFPENVPLQTREDGALLVQGTRITFDVIVNAFNRGETPEQIVDDFSTLSLSALYSLIGYYLGNRSTIDEYVRAREAAAYRQEIEARHPEMQGIRERLLRRRQAMIAAS